MVDIWQKINYFGMVVDIDDQGFSEVVNDHTNYVYNE